MRSKFQGVKNIIQFNQDKYLLGIFVLLSSLFMSRIVFSYLFLVISCFVFLSMFFSILVSYWVYDCSDLYELNYIPSSLEKFNLFQIHAGFDEMSPTLEKKYPNSNFEILDFYNPKIHTEKSIAIARKTRGMNTHTNTTKTDKIQYKDNHFDKIFLLFSAHEIRDDIERILFFKEINRVLKESGEVYVSEHLRDLPNFIAYNFGFLHFISKKKWLKTFREAGLSVAKEVKTTPFISNFILTKHGSSS